ncbi:DUF222 domain-containing protein, partial [Ilumatobacter sp.]|uniref:HNH endonuclease signature motif containing protein n=1 Tax=Ilumatobacter sp. TaxID=1967498 RepID=UPI003AF5CCA9
ELNVGDIGGFDADQVAGAFERVRIARGFIDHFEAVLTSHAARLHTNGAGAPAADVHTTCGGVSAAEGKRRERRSKTIEEAPAFGEALATGSIGAEHVDALANTTSKLDETVKTALLDREDDLLGDATRMSPERFGRSCRDLARLLERDQGRERNRRQRRDTFLSRRLNPATGMIEGRFSLHPELGNQIFGAVDREVAAMIATGERQGDTDFVERRYDRNRLAAEALGILVAGGHQQIRPSEADITLIVDAGTATSGELHDHSICETSDGAELPPASVARLLCEGRVTPVIVGANGTALDAGRTVRHANRAQRRALRAMYRSCAFGDCDVAFDRCEIHHVLPWEFGGPTDLANLLPLCSRHHHVVHEGGWRLELDDDRSLTITRPDGREFERCRPDLADRRTRRRIAA